MNLSVDIKYSMVEIMISLLTLEWYLWLPYRRVSVSCVSLWDKMLSSMFLIFWKRVCLGMRKLVQWRKKCIVDSISLLHSQIGFKVSWKQCLNLCSWRWLRPRRNLVNSLIPRGDYEYRKYYWHKVVWNFKASFEEYWSLLSF